MKHVVTCANESNIEQILDLVNKEFIVERGKFLHISVRYPFLFDKNNFENIFLIKCSKNSIAAVMAVKTIELLFEGKVYNLFLVGFQVTHPEYRGKGLGKFLFEYVGDYFLIKNFDLGVGWTRLQDYYIKTGWTPYENGVFVKCNKLKQDYVKETNVKITSAGIKEYLLLDTYRVENQQNYIVREKRHGIEGWGTVYSPGEKSLLLMATKNDKIVGYIYGVTLKNVAIIYEYKLDFIEIFPQLIENIYSKKNIDEVHINLSLKNFMNMDILKYFESVTINKPQLSIYKYNNAEIFHKLKDFYIPFTDRI